MICVHCQYEQEAGNYCTVCGTPFYESLTTYEEEPVTYQIIEQEPAVLHNSWITSGASSEGQDPFFSVRKRFVETSGERVWSR